MLDSLHSTHSTDVERVKAAFPAEWAGLLKRVRHDVRIAPFSLLLFESQ